MNKKLIKTIASITCGLGVVATIPAIASSCGDNENDWPINAIPKDVYKINENGELFGFVDGFDYSNYYGCNTIMIPKEVTSITFNLLDSNYGSALGIGINSFIFEKGSKCKSIALSSTTFADGFDGWNLISLPEGFEEIESGAFCAYSAGTVGTPLKIVLPSTIKKLENVFGIDDDNNRKIVEIDWNGLSQNPSDDIIQGSAFGNNNAFEALTLQGGIIRATNPKNGYTSEKLLTWFKTLPGFPQTGWTAK